MAKLFQAAFPSAISALEIGVWYGVGSTNIWLENLQPNSSLFLVDPWKPYASADDLSDPEWQGYKQMDGLSTDAYLSAFLNVKKFQAEQSHKQIKIHMTRGESSSFLPMLRDDCFDFIYIDGDHKYEHAKKDIQQAKRLVNKKFGIICGDDLDRQPNPELIEIAKNHRNRDYLRGEQQFHPGVLLAVSEEFPAVNMVNGIWWIVCSGGRFTTEILKPAPQPH